MSLFRAQVTIAHSSLGGIGTNNWSLRTTGSDPVAADEVDGLMDLVKDFYTNLSDVLAVGAAFDFNGECYERGGSEAVNTNAAPWTVTMGGSGGFLPPANTICVSWRAATGGRSGKGRTFLGPVKLSALDTDGTVDAAELATVRLVASQLVTASEGFTNGALGVYSVKDSQHRDMVASSVTDQFAVLRSRRD